MSKIESLPKIRDVRTLAAWLDRVLCETEDASSVAAAALRAIETGEAHWLATEGMARYSADKGAL
jgi:hypothetical protein